MKKLLQKKTTISAAEFDRRFDAGEDISEYVDWHKAKLIKPAMQRVAVDFPAWMVAAVDAEASRLGLTRQAILKVWVSTCLENLKSA